MNLYRLGRLPYVKGLGVQQVLFERLKARVINQIDKTNTRDPASSHRQEEYAATSRTLDSFGQLNSLVLVEHEPVYTIGLRTGQYDTGYENKLRDELDRHNLKADFIKTNRGGLITFHGPGQLVAYPILYLGDFHKIKNRSVKSYVTCLETTIIDTLARFGLRGAHTVREYPGVWLDGGQRKIAFVGIACKRYVTMHGISINCDCDLRWFEHIVSCGIEDKAITSIHREMLSTESNQFKNHQPIGGGSLSSPAIGSSPSPNSNNHRNHHNLHEQQQRQHQHQSSESLKCVVDVGHVSKTFCESFSQVFDCSLLEKHQHELDREIANLIK